MPDQVYVPVDGPGGVKTAKKASIFRAAATGTVGSTHLHEEDGTGHVHITDQAHDAEFAYIGATEHKDGHAESTCEKISKAFKKTTSQLGNSAGLFLLFFVTMTANGCMPLAVTWSKGEGNFYPFMIGVWLISMKCLVVIFSAGAYVLARRAEGKEYDKAENQITLGEKFKLSLWLLPPALMYTCSDVIAFLIMAHADAATYAVLRQCKILVVALLCRFILKRLITSMQWLAVLQLLASALLFKADLVQQILSGNSTAEVLGVELIMLKVSIDSVAVVWSDWAFSQKMSKHSLSFPEQQLSFASWTFFFSLVYFAMTGASEVMGGRPMYDGFNHGAWGSMILFSCYGMLVSLFLRYFDSLIKLFMALGAVCVTLVLDHEIFDVQIDIIQKFAAFFVLMSLLWYKLGTVVKKKKE